MILLWVHLPKAQAINLQIFNPKHFYLCLAGDGGGERGCQQDPGEAGGQEARVPVPVPGLHTGPQPHAVPHQGALSPL